MYVCTYAYVYMCISFVCKLINITIKTVALVNRKV